MAVGKNKAAQNRRAVIADLQRKNKRQDAVRNWGIVGVCVLIAVGVMAYPLMKLWHAKNPPYSNTALQDIGGSPQAAGCGAITKIKNTMGYAHVTTDVTYSTAPAAFGNHWIAAGTAPLPMDRKFYGSADAPRLEQLVHNLEHGYTILWYDDTITGKELDEVKGIANKFAGDTDFRDKFIAAPWTAADAASVYKKGDPQTVFPAGTHIAFDHWSVGGNAGSLLPDGEGVFQYCASPSGAALKAFMAAYPYTDSREPQGMSGTGVN